MWRMASSLSGARPRRAIFTDLACAEQSGEDAGQDGVAVVEHAVYLAAALSEPAFQDPVGWFRLQVSAIYFGFVHHGYGKNFSHSKSVEGLFVYFGAC
jgi:hypothetical protein